MSRAVIQIVGDETNGYHFFLESPWVEDGDRAHDLNVDFSGPSFAAFESRTELDACVRDVGSELFDGLQRHATLFNRLFRDIVNDGCPLNNPTPIYFDVRPTVIDRVPWETLHHDRLGFIALDSRWPIARLQRTSRPQRKPITDFFMPIRFMAILSAPSEDPTTRATAAGEWRALYETLSAARDLLHEAWELSESESALDLHVLVCEEDLLVEIEALNATWITADLVSSETGVGNAKVKFKPHFLHVFCHGNEGGLRVGTRAEWDAEIDGSISLSTELIVDPSDSLWLVTLNACGSASGNGAINFARTLVIKGVPGAIGMRQVIDTRLAAVLCRHFYDAALGQLGQLSLNGEPEPIEWAGCMSRVRKECVRDYHPQGTPSIVLSVCKHWTYPVLYSQPLPLLLRRQRTRTADRVRLLQHRQRLEAQIAALPGFADIEAKKREELRRDLQRKLDDNLKQMRDSEEDS